MGRPSRNTVDYFPHFISDGKKMFFIEKKYGNDGYATWFKILEKLASTENHFLDLNSEEEVMYLSAKCCISEDILLGIITDLSKVGAFDKMLWEMRIVWSQKFINEIQEVYNRRNNNCMTFDSLCRHLNSLGILKAVSGGLLSKKDDSNPQSRVEESRVEYIIPPYRKFKHLELSVFDFQKLTALGYSRNQVDGILDRIQNYAKNKSYTSLFLTAKNWLERDFPIQTLEQNEFLSQL